MNKFEKIINLFMRLLGILFLIESLGIFFGCYIPKTWAVGVLYLIIAIFLLVMKYSKPIKQ